MIIGVSSFMEVGSQTGSVIKGRIHDKPERYRLTEVKRIGVIGFWTEKVYRCSKRIFPLEPQ